MVINGKVVMIKATGKGLVAEIELERNEDISSATQTIRVHCPREPRELDVADDVVITISRKKGGLI